MVVIHFIPAGVFPVGIFAKGEGKTGKIIISFFQNKHVFVFSHVV